MMIVNSVLNEKPQCDNLILTRTGKADNDCYLLIF